MNAVLPTIISERINGDASRHPEYRVPGEPLDYIEAELVPEPAVRTLDDARKLVTQLGNCCRQFVQGRDHVISLVLTALFADGHVLLEDHPGSGKTTLAKALGSALERPGVPGTPGRDGPMASFRRVQFTPDLLPSDVTGVTIYDSKTSRFEFRHGPIFANILLTDEINRTSPKVQAALLEAMGEKQVTVDNETHALEEVFFVLATQNPLDLAGTYPLPRAQLDRFLFKIRMLHLSRAAELEVLARRETVPTASPFTTTPAAIVEARRIIRQTVRVSPAIHECLVDIAQGLRQDSRVAQGISTRSLVVAIPALQVWAAMHGRDFVSPQDLKALAVPLFSHRLELLPGANEADEIIVETVLPVIEQVTRRTLIK